MKTLNQDTKLAKQFLLNYWNSSNWNIRQCYKNPSWNKLNAEYFCRKKMSEENGRDFRILSHSHFYFTCGWITKNGLRVETKSNSYFIPNILIDLYI